MEFKVMKRCPLCDKTYDFFHVVVPGKDLHYRLCECGLLYHLWAMTEETLAEFYKNRYRYELGSPEVTNENIKEEMERADNIIQFIGAEINPRNVLDIGCSTGALLEKLRGLYGCQITGIEPGDKFREYSHGRGLNVVSGFEQLNGKFDLITIIHVLEHLVEPMPFLEKVQGFMADGGKLIVEVPVYKYAIEHPLLFSENSLRLMLETAGFTIEKLVANKDITAEAYIDT